MTPELLSELQEFVATFSCDTIDASFVLSANADRTELELSMLSGAHGDQRYLQLGDLGDDPRATLRAWAFQMSVGAAAKHAFDTFAVDGVPAGDCRVAGAGGDCVIDLVEPLAYAVARTEPLAPLPG